MVNNNGYTSNNAMEGNPDDLNFELESRVKHILTGLEGIVKENDDPTMITIETDDGQKITWNRAYYRKYTTPQEIAYYHSKVFIDPFDGGYRKSRKSKKSKKAKKSRRRKTRR